MTTYLHFLTKTVMHDRSPGFKAAINTHINRMDLIEEIIVFDSDIAYIDRLYDIYEWPELKEYLSESAMAHMLERDLGL
jgi:hypothetical protein